MTEYVQTTSRVRVFRRSYSVHLFNVDPQLILTIQNSFRNENRHFQTRTCRIT